MEVELKRDCNEWWSAGRGGTTTHAQCGTIYADSRCSGWETLIAFWWCCMRLCIAIRRTTGSARHR